MPAKIGMSAVMSYFAMKPSDFAKDWKKMSEQDKVNLKDAVGSYDEETGVATGPLEY
jgi:hypothetical protein